MTTIFLLIALQLVGEAIVTVTGLPIPGAVIGLILLYVILSVRGEASAEVTRTAGFLLDNLALLFVPAGVGVVQKLDLLAEHGAAIAAILAISVMVTLLVTVATFLLASRLVARWRGGR